MTLLGLLRQIVKVDSLFPFKTKIKGGQILLIAAWFLFTYTVFSGALRKWLFGPGQLNNIVFILQLVSPFLFFILAFVSRSRINFKIPPIFTVFLFYLTISALNPKNHTIFHGIFGLLIHLGFWAGLIAYLQRRHSFEIEKLVIFFVLVLAGEVILASIQYSLPEDHILNIKGNGNAIDAFVGKAVRVSGTFSYIGGFQVMITFYGFLIWFLLVLEFPFIITALVFALSLYAALMCGSRGSLLMLLFMTGFAFIHTRFIFKRFSSVIVTLLILGGFVFYFGDSLIKSFDEAYENFAIRVEEGFEAGETELRFEEPFKDVLNFQGKYPIFGIGLGSTYQGANIMFGESFYSKEFGGYEGELGRVILEGGFILFFLRLIVLFYFLRKTYIPSMGQFVVFIFFLFSVVVFNTYQGIFLLFGVMLVDRAYYLKSIGSKIEKIHSLS